MSERVLFATIKLKPGKKEALRAAFEPMYAQVATEPGTLQYTLVDGDEVDTLYVIERYADQDAMDAHMASPAMAALGAALADCVAGGGMVTGTPLRDR